MVSVSSGTQESGRLWWNPRTGKWKSGIGTMCRDVDSTSPHFLFLTSGTFPTVFSALKADPAGPGRALEVIYASFSAV